MKENNYPERLAYLPLYTKDFSLAEAIDGVWNGKESGLIMLEKTVPKPPYLKVRMEVVEVVDMQTTGREHAKGNTSRHTEED